MSSLTFAAAILTALPYFLRLESDELRTANKKQFRHEVYTKPLTYDFIIVGAGTAGCIVANRLSKHFRVLLIEAGGEPPSATSVPAFFDYVSNSPDISYPYVSIPQTRANNQRLPESMGKMLGGSGSHNALIYNRGHPKDYATWAQMTGDPSWSYNSLLKYFRTAETYLGIWPKGIQHGSDGPLSIVTSKRPIDQLWNAAASELGYEVRDPNGPQREGFTPLDVMTTADGHRVSTYTGYIQPIKSREKLTIITYANVEEILMSNLKATGVRYFRHGVEFTAYASMEVVLCAGTFATPILLFKSGIGPAEMLAHAKIKTKLDLPAVGQNLQDHGGVFLGPFSISDPSIISTVNHNLTESDFNKYLKHEYENVLSETGLGPQALIVSDQAKARGEFDWPDIQIINEPPPLGTNLPANQFYVSVSVARSMSLGSVKLNTKAFLQGVRENSKLSVIDYKFLEAEQDYQNLVFGIQTALKVFSTNTFKSVGVNFIGDGECNKNYKFNTDKYWKCYLGRNAELWFHPAGTCRMSYGSTDLNSVVDSHLRVHGLQGLRIVDASIMPKVTNANINAPVVAIAEKASEIILKTYRS